MGGQGFGVVDVVFVATILYYLITGGSTTSHRISRPIRTAVYHIEKDGSSKLVANISKFNDDNR